MPDPIRKSYSLPFEPAQVYAAWVSPSSVVPPASRLEIDLRVGGTWKLFSESPAGTAVMTSRYLAIEPGRHLTYTWEWDENGEETQVDVAFRVGDDGGTTLEIAHAGFQSQDSRDRHDAGWDSYVAGLRALMSAG